MLTAQGTVQGTFVTFVTWLFVYYKLVLRVS